MEGEGYDQLYLKLKIVLNNEKYNSNECKQELYDVYRDFNDICPCYFPA